MLTIDHAAEGGTQSSEQADLKTKVLELESLRKDQSTLIDGDPQETQLLDVPVIKEEGLYDEEERTRALENAFETEEKTAFFQAKMSGRKPEQTPSLRLKKRLVDSLTPRSTASGVSARKNLNPKSRSPISITPSVDSKPQGRNQPSEEHEPKQTRKRSRRSSMNKTPNTEAMHPDGEKADVILLIKRQMNNLPSIVINAGVFADDESVIVDVVGELVESS